MPLPNDIIQEAKLALDELKKKNAARARQLIEAIILSNETQLRENLSNLQSAPVYTNDERVMFFDTANEEKNIRLVALNAIKSLNAGRTWRARRCLKKIIALENNIIGENEKIRDYREEGNLGAKAVFETAIAYYLRNMLDPYAQSLGREADLLLVKIKNLESVIGQMKEVSMNYAGEVWAHMKKLLGIEEKSIQNGIKGTKEKVVNKEVQEMQAVSYEPTIWPHYDLNAPYQVQFSQLLWIAIIGALGVAAVLNLRTYIKNKLMQRKIRKAAVSLARVHNARVREIVRQIGMERGKMKELSQRTDMLTQGFMGILELMARKKVFGSAEMQQIRQMLMEADSLRRETETITSEAPTNMDASVRALAREIKETAKPTFGT